MCPPVKIPTNLSSIFKASPVPKTGEVAFLYAKMTEGADV